MENKTVSGVYNGYDYTIEYHDSYCNVFYKDDWFCIAYNRLPKVDEKTILKYMKEYYF